MVRQRIAYFIIAVLFLGGMWYDHTQGRSAQTAKIEAVALAACKRLNTSNATLKDYILDQIARSEKTLPTLEYYKEHPDEMQNALNNIRKQKRETIQAFAPVPC